MLQQAYGGETLSCAAVFQWWSHFKDGNTRVIDKASSGRQSTAVTDVNITKAGELLENDRRLRLRELSASLNISFEHTQHIVRDTANASCVCVCARWVPRNLTEEQMQQVQVCTNTVQMSETIPNFLTSIVTCDESWIHHHDPLSKQQCGITRIRHHPKNSVHLSQRVKSCFCCSLMCTGWSYSTGFPMGRQWRATIMQTSWKPICVEPWGRKHWICSRNSGFCSRIMPGHILLLWHWQHWLKLVGYH